MEQGTFGILTAIATAVLSLAIVSEALAAPKRKRTPTPPAATPTTPPEASPTPTRTPPASGSPTVTPTNAPASTRTPAPPPGGLAVAIVGPAAGATVAGDRVTVHGTVRGAANVAVLVNDVAAQVAGGVFAANDVPLAAGENRIVAVARTASGWSAEHVVTVTRGAGESPLVFGAVPTEGVASLVVTFECRLLEPRKLRRLEVDFDGDGRADLRTNRPSPTFSNAYDGPGVHVAAVAATDDLGTVHRARVGIRVDTTETLDAAFFSVWDPFVAALAAGDAEAAREQLDAGVREELGAVLDELRADLPAVAASLSRPRRIEVSPHLLEYGAERTVGGETYFHFLDVARDGDGLWRLQGF